MSQTDARLLSRAEAAAYCGLKPSRFSEWVKSGLVPPPLPGTKKWDRRAIDLQIDKISGIKAPEKKSALEAWKERKNAGRA